MKNIKIHKTVHLIHFKIIPLKIMFKTITKIAICLSLVISLQTHAQLPTFAAAVDYTTGIGSNPSGVAIGDFNGDGFPDLAIVNNGSGINTVSILTNSGIGNFGGQTNYPTGSSPRSVAVGDFNRDGFPDLAVVNLSGNSISVLTNTGTGSFGAKVDYATGSSPIIVAIGDVNSDGFPDLAVANSANGANTVSVLTNTGTGSFGAKVDYPTGRAPVSVAIGDVNGDGFLDLATANYTDNSVSVLTNTGTGRFGTKADILMGANPNPYSVVIGDWNGDGFPDLATANFSLNTISIFTNTGIGSFGTRANHGTGANSNPYSLAIGDLNGDGRPDLATGNFSTNTIALRINTGEGIFDDWMPISTGLNSRNYNVVIGDLNGDYKPDLVIVNFGLNKISILFNSTDFPTSIFKTTPNTISTKQSLTIAGYSLSSTTGVQFAGGVMANPTSISASKVVVNIPCGAVSGLITLTGTNAAVVSPSILTITSAPNTQIVTQPISTSSCSGTLASFIVSAAGTNLSYIWSNGLSTTNSMNTSVLGSNYLVTVSGTCGASQVSNAVSLTGIGLTSIQALPPVITVCSGISVPLVATATGANLVYAWSTGISGANATVSSSGTYMVTVTGTCGAKVSNAVQVTVSDCNTVTIPGTSTGLNISESNSGFVIYPNPNAGTFVIDFPSFENLESLNSYTISSIEGKVLAKGFLTTGKNEISTSLSKGIYFVKVGNGVRKLIIE